MTGIDDLLAESNDRWAKAMKRSQDVEDVGLGPALRIYYTRYFPAGLAIVIVAGTVIGALTFGAAPSVQANYLAILMALAAFGALVGGLVFNSKKMLPAVHYGGLDVMLSLENEERKHVRRQIAGKATLDHEDLQVVRAAAVQQRKGLATQILWMPFYPFFFIFQATGVATFGGLFWWILVVATAGMMLGAVFFVRDFRRTGQFLAQTSET